MPDQKPSPTPKNGTRKMTNIGSVLEQQIHVLSEMSDPDLSLLIQQLERAYIHVLIEQGLRGAQAQEVSSVSNLPTRARSI